MKVAGPVATMSLEVRTAMSNELTSIPIATNTATVSLTILTAVRFETCFCKASFVQNSPG
jgi:hypothetical protein